ncbi:hypothetical protein BDQ12DRAFT_714841 [Crucibulum laeve]|uniref:DUF6534 domain-containing protein n=1 Tax=Crucibulum laeve TaxID=68775 RepID=A0A5C3LQQ0_9AGAR|nr:hypothetical protein BDQ12DRAFT_714841 [Crucibulum laeve]
MSYRWIDLGHLVLISQAGWHYLVANWGNMNALQHVSAPLALHLTLLAVSCILCQVFFLYRIWVLSRSNIILVGFLSSGCLAAFAFDIALTCQMFIDSRVSSLDAGPRSKEVYSAYSLSAAFDLCIALILCYYLTRARTGAFRDSRLMVRLMEYTIATGLATSLLAIACLIAFIARPHEFIFFSIPGLRATTKQDQESKLGCNAKPIRKESNPAVYIEDIESSSIIEGLLSHVHRFRHPHDIYIINSIAMVHRTGSKERKTIQLEAHLGLNNNHGFTFASTYGCHLWCNLYRSSTFSLQGVLTLQLYIYFENFPSDPRRFKIMQIETLTSLGRLCTRERANVGAIEEEITDRRMVSLVSGAARDHHSCSLRLLSGLFRARRAPFFHLSFGVQILIPQYRYSYASVIGQLVDMCHLVLISQAGWHYLISNWGYDIALQYATPTLDFHVVPLAVASIIFNNLRIWVLSGHRWLLVAFLAAGCLTTFGLDIVQGVHLYQRPGQDSFHKWPPEVIAVFSIGAGRQSGSRTDFVIARFMEFTFATGLATSLVAIGCMVAGMHFSLGRLYTNAVLARIQKHANLATNSAKRMRHDNEQALMYSAPVPMFPSHDPYVGNLQMC